MLAQIQRLTWEYHCTRQEALTITIHACGISDFCWNSEIEVLQAIKQANSDMHAALEAYLTAYEAWYEFVVQCQRQNKDYPLKGDDYCTMGTRMLERDKARHSWQQLIE